MFEQIIPIQLSAHRAYASVLPTANAPTIPNAACNWIELIITMQNLWHACLVYEPLRTKCKQYENFSVYMPYHATSLINLINYICRS